MLMATRAWGMPPSLDSIPVTVLTALRRLDESLLPEWVQMQDELAALSSDSAHITAREAVRAAAGLVSGPGRPVGDALVERHGLGPSQRDLPAVREDPGDLGGPGAAGGLGSVLAEPGFSSALSRVKPSAPGGLALFREFPGRGACAGLQPGPAAGTMCRCAGGSRHRSTSCRLDPPGLLSRVILAWPA
jgi:hypothetical protein